MWIGAVVTRGERREGTDVRKLRDREVTNRCHGFLPSFCLHLPALRSPSLPFRAHFVHPPLTFRLRRREGGYDRTSEVRYEQSTREAKETRGKDNNHHSPVLFSSWLWAPLVTTVGHSSRPFVLRVRPLLVPLVASRCAGHE